MITANGKTLVMIPANATTYRAEFYDPTVDEYIMGTCTPLYHCKLMGWKNNVLCWINLDIVEEKVKGYALDMPNFDHDPMYFDTMEEIELFLREYLEKDFSPDFWD